MALTLPTLAPQAPTVIDPDDLQFARHDPMLCGFPGLFRYVDHKERDATRTGLRLTYQHGDLTIEAHNSVLLGGIELAVLQALVGLAAISGDTLDPSTLLRDHEQQLVDELAALPEDKSPVPAVQEITADVRRVDFAGSHLLNAIGLPVCGQNRALVAQAVRNLATVTLLVYPTNDKRQLTRYHLLSSVQTGTQTDKWARTHVALNPRLTEIILGIAEDDSDERKRHTRISLLETRKFGSDQVARILHQRLCSWINDGATRPVSYKTLIEYVWPADAEQQQADLLRRANDKTFARKSAVRIQHERLELVVRGLNKIECLLPGWEVTAASQLPAPAHDKSKTDEENIQIGLRHQAYCVAAARDAKADVLNTVVHIKRAWLPKFSNKSSGIVIPQR